MLHEFIYDPLDLRFPLVETATPEGLLPPLSAAMLVRLGQWDRGAGFAAIRAAWLGWRA